MAQSPCFSPCKFPFFSSIPFTYLESLLAVMGSRPPWSQVARKLISPFPSPPHSLPFQNPDPLGFSCAKCTLTNTTSQNWLTSPEQYSLTTYSIIFLGLKNQFSPFCSTAYFLHLVDFAVSEILQTIFFQFL
jgi:hypothetical protein